MTQPEKQDFSEEIKRIFELASRAQEQLEAGCTLNEFFTTVDLIEISCRMCKEMLVFHSKLTDHPITMKGLPDRRHFKGKK